MDEYPGYTYSQSAAQYTAWIAEKYPQMNDQIRQRVKEGRWEIVGGMWVEPDLNLPDGESLVRQLLVGQRYFNQQYGVTARIGWNPDSFGYNWQLPQIYKRSGMDYFVTQKMHWNDTNQLPFRLFWWQSPDGSKVLTYFPTDYVHDNVNPTRISADFAESAQRNPGTAEMLDLYGIGDHGGGPTRAMLDQADQWIAPTKQRRRPHHALPHRAKLLLRRRKKPQPRLPHLELRLHRQGLHRTTSLLHRSHGPPHLERRALLRIPPRRLHHTSPTQTQHAHQRSSDPRRRKASILAWLNGRPYPN